MALCALRYESHWRSFEMSKKPIKKSSRYDGPMTAGMKFFLAGCVAELYLLVIRRFYVNGTIDQMLAWHEHLLLLVALGMAALTVGLVLMNRAKENKAKKELAWYFLGGGAFVAIASGLIRHNMSALSILTTLVPVVLVIDVLWWLFDRDSALSLTALAAALLVVWMCRRGAVGISGLLVKALGAACIAALVIIPLLVKNGKLAKLISSEGHKMVYAACLISAAGVAAALVSATLAYYVMWVLAAAMFCLAVYYTVRQL